MDVSSKMQINNTLDTTVCNPHLCIKWEIFCFLKSSWLVCISSEILSLLDHTDAAAFEISWLQKEPALVTEIRYVIE